MLLNWMHGHEVLLWWMGVLSILMFVGTLVVIPMLVARIPADYFLHKNRIRDRQGEPNYIWEVAGLVLKNVLGLLLIVLGLSMLVLPGQGILTIVLGLMCMNFPGKWSLERRIVSQPKILHALNWMRTRAGRPPLEIEQQ